MPRDLDTPLLNEMVSESGGTYTLLPINNTPYIQAYINTDINNYTDYDLPVIAYSYDGINLKITSERMPDSDFFYMSLRRGLTISGVNYYAETNNFSVVTVKSHPNGTYTYEAKLFPRRRVSVPGDQSYRDVISAVCTELGYTAVFKDPTEDFWDYQFFPDGRTMSVNNAEQFLILLKSKYFIYACDNGPGEILFFAAREWAANYYPVHASSSDMYVEYQTLLGAGRYSVLSRDENNTVHRHTPPTSEASFDQAPIHNLGFLPSTALGPNSLRSNPSIETKYCGYKPTDFSATIPINLWLQNGDRVTLTTNTGIAPGLLNIIEYLDTSKTPTWGCKVENLKYITNTEGGAMPSTIEAAAPYTPLSTVGFGNFLTDAVNNLQAFADWVNDFAMSPRSIYQSPEKDTPEEADFFGYVDWFTGGLRRIAWVSIRDRLKTYYDGIYTTAAEVVAYVVANYAPIAKGVTNGDTHNHSGGDGGTIAYSSLSGTPTIPSTEDIQDTVGGMVSGNSETGITVTYDDSGGKINFDAQTPGDARYVKQTGDTMTGNLLLAATKDIFPAGDIYGLWGRIVDWGFTPDEHWKQNVDELAWTGFASYTNYVTPSLTATTLSTYQMANNAGSRSSFRYRAAATGAHIFLRARLGITFQVSAGVMIDDGVGNADGNGADNFYRAYITQSTLAGAITAVEQYRTGGGAITTNVGPTIPYGQFIGLGIRTLGTRWTSWSANPFTFGEMQQPVQFTGGVGSLTWTPARVGIYGVWTAVDHGRRAIFDWYDEATS